MREAQEIHEVDEVEATEVVAIPPDSMVESQVATARRFPRSVARFRKESEQLVCLDEESAGDCLYALKRSGKVIEGPSARLAEILLYSWGNARAEAEVVEEGPVFIVASGTFFDLERNVAIRKRVSRRITDKHGRRYAEDMIAVTGNAAVSIALRNVVLAGIPRALWSGIYRKARAASLGKGGTLTQKRQAMVDYFGKLAVTPEQVYRLAEVQGVEDIGEDQLIFLRGVANAIRDGEQTVEQVFAEDRDESRPTPDLASRARAAREGAT